MIIKIVFILIASIRADFDDFSDVNIFNLEPVEECVNERYRCNEFLEHPCCDESNVCDFIGSLNKMAIYACMRKQYLEDNCESDSECSTIPHALCNSDNKCDCENDYIGVNRTSCVPLITSRCLRDEDCAVNNSICVNRECTCKPSFFSRFNDHCKPTKLGEYCSSNYDCGDITHVICSERKICICKPNHTVKNNATCAPNLEQFCEDDNVCAPDNSFCKNRACRCKNGYIPLSKNSCVPTTLGQYCSTDDDCLDLMHMKCLTNKCICKTNHMIVNNTICASLLGEFCYDDDECGVENSVCSDYMCECRRNYVMETPSSCVQTPLEKKCTNDFDCGSIFPIRCSADNKCICAENYTTIRNTTCELLLGAECSEELPCIAQNSVCVNHKCECKANFRTNLANGQCEPTLLGKYCNRGLDCEDVFHMKCFENRCVCRGNNIVVNFQCRSLLEGYCWSNDYCLPFNSECTDHECLCKKDYIRISSDRCIPTRLGQTCEFNSDCKLLNVPCSVNKTCDLEDFLNFN